MARRVLYIEDDADIGKWVKEDLERRGYEVDWLVSGEEAAARVAQADLVVLDVMLPGLDGFTVGRRLKKEAPNVPILMLSARTAVDDKLQGLQFADDYLTKPFHPDELAARLEVLQRRAGLSSGEPLVCAHLLIHPEQQRVVDSRTGEEISLTAKQLQILFYFLRNRGQILTKEQIYEAVWGEPYMDGDKTVNVHIRYLRERIELDPSDPRIIETIRGIGYRVRP
ncbi:response regulator transcription factor [Cohnella lubricantis]|uniref:Response regulator transcription factor n=1 Tax=Cohnella lubricantis TaxID=2163172 RepID=A0A841TG41_9BACL|nr:response regulator transcription factor [Cohnella lubricantis]MBB6679326.1 response regulator transcription factor [Cohnella lubricantis]MBP2120117.1 DNA-binding response OmpR family regulator [Cohnella lubricantis]